MNERENQIRFYRENDIELVWGRSQHSFPMHSHDSFCIGIVTDGRIRFKLTTGEFVLGKNQVYVIPPFTEHTILPADYGPYSYCVICLDHQLQAANGLDLWTGMVFSDELIGQELLEACCCCGNTHSYRQLGMAIMKLIIEYTEPGSGPVKKQNKEYVKNAAFYIKEHIKEPFALQELCNYTHITKYHLSRVFKDQMGVTPYQYYIQERVRSIKRGLAEERTTLDIACDLSFSDQSHLCNTFKKHVGLSPKQYQKSYIEG